MPRIEDPNFRKYFLGILDVWKTALSDLESMYSASTLWKFKTIRSAARARVKFCIYVLNGDHAKATAEDRKMRERYSDVLDEAMFEPHRDVRITEETIRTWAERLKTDHELRAQHLAMLKACMARESSEEGTEAQAVHELVQTITADDLAGMQRLTADDLATMQGLTADDRAAMQAMQAFMATGR